MVKCVVCEKEIEKSKYLNKTLCSSKCFHTDFWNDEVKKKYDQRVVRVQGEQYWIGNENDNSGFRGYSGRKFNIKFFDGRIVETTNLWNNGTIPEDFKHLLSDNAEFIGEPAW